jgi:hypothetical protein
MITCCGLLDLSDGALSPDVAWKRVDSVFDCYRAREDKPKFKHLATELFGLPYHNKPAAEPVGKSTKIFFIGVWDTVGALGIPADMAFLKLLDNIEDHSFHDTQLSDAVLNARHAVAIDEHRQTFTPTFWTNVDSRLNVKQIWFPGCHSDVGGGFAQVGLSDGALKWMIDEAAALGLNFRPTADAQIKPDCHGVLHDSLTGVFTVLKSCPRDVPNLAEQPPSGQFHKSASDRFADPPIQQANYWPTAALKVGESKTFDVFARERWNATGLYLAAGSYEFAASGQWLDASIKCDPDGKSDNEFQIGRLVQMAGSALGVAETLFRHATGNQQANFLWTKRVDTMDWFALVGVVANGVGANAAGDPLPDTTFLIGSNAKRDVNPVEAGYLYCFANDAWQAYGNNNGSVSLTVTRTA